MKVIQQDWGKIRNQLWNKKQGSNKAKCSETDIWLKLGKMPWRDKSKSICFHQLVRFLRENFKQEICNFIYIFIFRSTSCIFRFIFSNKARYNNMNTIKVICTTPRVSPFFFLLLLFCKCNTSQLSNEASSALIRIMWLVKSGCGIAAAAGDVAIRTEHWPGLRQMRIYMCSMTNSRHN